MLVQDKKLTWKNDNLAIREFKPKAAKANVLIMHGAGYSSQERSRSLAKSLAANNYHVVTFDFTSHGRSSGTLEELSLEKRQQQAEFVLKSLKLTKNLVLIGFSMGGQTAIDVMHSTKQVKSLILFTPGVYDKRAKKAYFGKNSSFSSIIRRSNSWQDSDEWNKLAQFSGNVLIFQAERDNRIPNQIPKMLFESSKNAKKCMHVLIKKSPHSIAKWMSLEPKRAIWFGQMISNFLQNNSEFPSSKDIQYEILGEYKSGKSKL